MERSRCEGPEGDQQPRARRHRAHRLRAPRRIV